MLPIDSDTNIGTGLVILAWTLFSVSFIIVALRIWTRVVVLKDRMVLHDWLMVCAIISEICHVAILQAAKDAGLGYHIDQLTVPQIMRTGHFVITVESFSVLTSFFGRVSFACFLLSVVGHTKRATRVTLFTLIAVQIIINAVVIIQVYTQCGSKMEALWNPSVHESAHCSAPEVETYIGYCQASLNSLSDLVLTILPLTIVWSLSLPSATKAAVGALLCLSSFALVASIAKAIEIQLLSSGPDFTWHFAILQYCVVVECDVVMIAASMPMLRALWRDGSNDAHSPSYLGSGSRRPTLNRIATLNDGTVILDDEERALSVLSDAGIRMAYSSKVRSGSCDKNQDEVDVSSDISLGWR
ncbi:hypothetical protein MBLNU459_g5294t1 [Dothideomycetes sp. NU459]